MSPAVQRRVSRGIVGMLAILVTLLLSSPGVAHADEVAQPGAGQGSPDAAASSGGGPPASDSNGAVGNGSAADASGEGATDASGRPSEDGADKGPVPSDDQPSGPSDTSGDAPEGTPGQQTMPQDATMPIVKASVGADASCTLTWTTVPRATRYAVAVAQGDGWRTYSYDYVGTSLRLFSLEPGRAYTFLVQACVEGEWTPIVEQSQVQVVYAPETSPTNVEAHATDVAGAVGLSWAPVSGATRYAVAELMEDGSWRAVDNDVSPTATTCSVLGLWPGRSHSFLVQAQVDGIWSPASQWLVVSAAPSGDAKPRVSVSAGEHDATLSWSPVPGASRYAVAIRVGSIWHTYTYGETGIRFSLDDLDGGKPYHILVQAYVDGSWTSFDDSDVTRVVATGTAPAVARPTFEASYANGWISVNWEPVPGATRYAVAEQLPNGTYWTFTYEATGTSFSFGDMDGGRTYPILVQAYKDGVWSSFSASDLKYVWVPVQYSTQMERNANTWGLYSATNWLILVDVSSDQVGIFYWESTRWRLVRSCACAAGKPSTPTVTGQFVVGSKGYSFGHGYTCYYYTQFFGDYLFHSVLYYPNSSVIKDGTIGRNVSHGCVRLNIQDAKWIYDNIPQRTKVYVYR